MVKVNGRPIYFRESGGNADSKKNLEQLQQVLLPGGPPGAGGGKDPASAGIVSAAPTSPPGGVMRHKCDYLYEIYVRAAGP